MHEGLWRKLLIRLPQNLSEKVFERPPETLRGTARDLIQGAYKLQDSLLLILDTDKTLNLALENNLH